MSAETRSSVSSRGNGSDNSIRGGRAPQAASLSGVHISRRATRQASSTESTVRTNRQSPSNTNSARNHKELWRSNTPRPCRTPLACPQTPLCIASQAWGSPANASGICGIRVPAASARANSPSKINRVSGAAKMRHKALSGSKRDIVSVCSAMTMPILSQMVGMIAGVLPHPAPDTKTPCRSVPVAAGRRYSKGPNW